MKIALEVAGVSTGVDPVNVRMSMLPASGVKIQPTLDVYWMAVPMVASVLQTGFVIAIFRTMAQDVNTF